ncbi:glycosyltransferase family 9 protein [Niveispirillum sp. KHB5.9]|uniref:glycosyltransferase family 9 protein n=1 Tax=Niveispirillum sp. KHB5.9 TaxID=3400269 RepID=UPI003A87A0FA
MHAFLVAEDFTLNTTRFVRLYRGGKLEGEVPLDRLVIDIGGEADMVRKAMEADHKKKHEKDEVLNLDTSGTGSGAEQPSGTGSGDGSGADAPKTDMPQFITTVNEGALLSWDGTPPRLGRVSARFNGPGLFRHPDEGDVLGAQLESLKARHPGRKHFRLAVVNAFGSNLGDCMLGMTALRHVAKYLKRYLGSFTIDLLLGANSGITNFDIAGHDDWVGDQFLIGPTLQEFSRYDAYFDFSGLIALPRITEIAISDWYLWWCGLDPETVPAADKRNVMSHQWPVWQDVTRTLQGIKGKKIFFNPKASVPLRTFADAHVPKFLKKLLKIAPDVTIVVDREIKLDHPRLIDLSKAINSAGKFAALVAQMDGVISVDSFALHAADSGNVPAVGLFASIDPYAYPYYPHHKGILIPDGEKLSFYKKFKTNTDEEWDGIKDAYGEAWGRLDPEKVYELLQAQIAAKGNVPHHMGTRMIHGPHTKQRYRQTAQGRELPYENPPEIWTRAQRRLQEIGRTLIRPRTQMIMVTPGQSELPVAIAQLLEHEGRMHVFEPRDARRQLIGMDILDRAAHGLTVTHYDTFPGKVEQASFGLEDALSETNPANWGGLRDKKTVRPKSIDEMKLDTLSSIVMSAPAPWKLVLESALETLERTKAAVLIGPLASFQDVREIATLLLPIKYQCWVEQLEPGKNESSILLAVSDQVKVQGLKRVQFN